MSSRPFRRATLALVAVALTALSACSSVSTGGSDSGSSDQVPATASSAELRKHATSSLEGKTAAFVPVGMGTPLTEEWDRQLRSGFEAAGMKYVMRDPNWDTSKQAEAVQSLINEKPAVLVVHNFDVQVLAKLIQKAQQAGIYVIQINMVSNYKSDAFVGADTIGLGRQIASDIVEQCGSSTSTSHEVQIVQGDATSGFTLDLMEGAKSVFDKDKSIKIVSTQAANWDRTKAHDITATVIQQHPNLCASWGFWDQMQYGAATAIKEAGKAGKVKVFTSDHSTIACEGIRDGLIYESYGYSVPSQGSDIVAIAKQLVQGDQKPGTTRIADYTPLVKINKSNWNQAGICYDGKHDSVTIK
jgi:ribose transport system substrate-binding protein